MKQVQFQSYNDFLLHLEALGPDVALLELLQQLEQEFYPALLDAKLVGSFDPKTLVSYKLLPLLHHQGILHIGTTQVSEEFQQAMQKAFGCQVSLYPISIKVYEQLCSSLLHNNKLSQNEMIPLGLRLPKFSHGFWSKRKVYGPVISIWNHNTQRPF